MFKARNILLGLLFAIGICILMLFTKGVSEVFIYNNF